MRGQIVAVMQSGKVKVPYGVRRRQQVVRENDALYPAGRYIIRVDTMAYGVRRRQQVVRENDALYPAGRYIIRGEAANRRALWPAARKSLLKRVLSSELYQYRSSQRESRRLADALAELAEVDDEIAEENLPQVGATTKVEAERLVRALTGRAPARVLLAVYPTQDAGIALHFKAPGRPDAVLVLLRDDGRADCHAYIGGRSRRAHYGTSSDLPDVWVLDQLRHLAPTPVGVSTPGAGFSPSWTAFLSKNLLLTW